MNLEGIREKDLESIWNNQVKIDRYNEVIIKIKPDDDLYLVSSFVRELEGEIKSLEEQNEKLRGYLECDHSDIQKGIYDGHDSHKDYCFDKCKKCGRIINRYSI